jgi:hypothetical protein
MMIFARHGADSDKDYAEFVRITRRSVKLIMESPAEAPNHNASGSRHTYRQTRRMPATTFETTTSRRERDSRHAFDHARSPLAAYHCATRSER